MDSKRVPSCLMILMMFSVVSSDFTQDKKECQDQLIGLSSCLSFVSGDAKAPPLTCCTELRKDASKSKLCLCILVRDRNEPGLGFKLNATLALSLPSTCNTQSIAKECPGLLHLAPTSPEAQVFEQFNTTLGVGSSTSSGDTIPSSSTSLSIKGIQQAAMDGVLIWILLSVCIGKM